MADKVTITINAAPFTQRLHQYLQASGHAVDQATVHLATAVGADIVEHWPVDSGQSRAAWIGPTRLGPASYQLSNPVDYAAAIEYGSYRGVGPKTARFGGAALLGGLSINAGIFPTQVPQAPVRRALSANYHTMGAAVLAALKRPWGHR